MKSFLITVFHLIWALSSYGNIRFLDTEFKQTSSDGKDGVYSLAEYILEGETEDNYTQKISILIDETETELEKSIKAQVAEFKERTKSEPNFKYSFVESSDGRYVIFDYMSKTDKKADFNIIKYYLIENGDKKSIGMIHYKMRSYGDDIPSFYNYIQEKKEQYIVEMRKM